MLWEVVFYQRAFHSLAGNTSTEINADAACSPFWFNALFLCSSCWVPFCSLFPLCARFMEVIYIFIYTSAEVNMWRNLNCVISKWLRLTVHGKCARGAWPRWRWPDKHSWEPAWRTWTLLHTQHDLKTEKKISWQRPCPCAYEQLSLSTVWLEHLIYLKVQTLTCKFNMELILRFEYLDIKGTIWSEVLHCPGPQDGLMVLKGNSSRWGSLTFASINKSPLISWVHDELLLFLPQPCDLLRCGCLE